MTTKIFLDNEELSDFMADQLVDQLMGKPTSLICFASGNSPKRAATLFVEKVIEKNIDTRQFKFIGLDEWVGVASTTKGSCHHDFKEWIFDPLGIQPNQYHLFDGTTSDLSKACIDMDEFIAHNGGIDLMIVGIGMNGHIGFNEPGVDFNQLSHVVPLDEITATVGQQYFEKPMQLTHGITLGFRHLLQSKKVYMLANSRKKAEVVKRAIEGEVDRSFPASIMQQHTNGFILIDEAAAALLGS
ncbi:MAG: glucosamine-6-phosphate deaminase [Chitinophagaceae bacterium]|jgi:glucosamine-6-phosphate isomerase